MRKRHSVNTKYISEKKDLSLGDTNKQSEILINDDDLHKHLYLTRESSVFKDDSLEL